MIHPDVLKQAQKIMLEMLVEFDKICKKHHLKYWLDSGTLLGAVRHQGFIPWDDDIDLCMPVEDYNTLIDIAKFEFSENIFFQTSQTDPHFKFDYIKLRSNKANIVEFHEKEKDVGYHQGVFVDIFPMLTVEDTPKMLAYYADTLTSIRAVSAVSLHTPDGIYDPQKRKVWVDSLELCHQGWENKKNKLIYSGKMPDVAASFDMEEVFPLAKLSFEGLTFPVPKNPQHYLSEIYSFNFMELPPKEKRIIHAWDIILKNNDMRDETL